jgi:hypothetical protein
MLTDDSRSTSTWTSTGLCVAFMIVTCSLLSACWAAKPLVAVR